MQFCQLWGAHSPLPKKRALRQPSLAVVTSPPDIADKQQINVTAVSQPGRRPMPSQLGTPVRLFGSDGQMGAITGAEAENVEG